MGLGATVHMIVFFEVDPKRTAERRRLQKKKKKQDALFFGSRTYFSVFQLYFDLKEGNIKDQLLILVLYIT